MHPAFNETVPLYHEPIPARWEGVADRKPWQHQITAVIPCFNHYHETVSVVALLRLQTVKPYIILVDTGSTPHQYASLRSLAAPDLELHAIRSNGTPHPCSLIASALDLGFSLAETPYVFTTHQDCFLVARDFLEYLQTTIVGHDAVGYQLSPRPGTRWREHLGHTATLWDLNSWDRIGATWTLRRCRHLLHRSHHHQHHSPDPAIDTEASVNAAYLNAGAKIAFVGTEQNYERTLDANIDHCRSLVCSSLYSPPHHERAHAWATDAMRLAQRRIRDWTTYGPAENPPDPPSPPLDPPPETCYPSNTAHPNTHDATENHEWSKPMGP